MRHRLLRRILMAIKSIRLEVLLVRIAGQQYKLFAIQIRLFPHPPLILFISVGSQIPRLGLVSPYEWGAQLRIRGGRSKAQHRVLMPVLVLILKRPITSLALPAAEI